MLGIVIGSTVTGAVTAAQHEAAERAAAEQAEAARSIVFADARDECSSTAVIQVSDGGRTMIVDGEGEDLGSGDVTVTELLCLLGALDAPTSVNQKMLSTRSLDGRQSGDWGDVSASWTYHPDDGLDAIFELRD